MDLKSKNISAIRKRPEMALYRPGMGKILGKKPDKHNKDFNDTDNQNQDFCDESKDEFNYKSEEKADNIQIDSRDSNKSNNDNKIVNKKPDIKVYVPKKLNNSIDHNNHESEKQKRQVFNPEKNHDKHYGKSYDRNHENRNHEKSYDRNHEKSYDRNHEKSFDRNHEKSFDRNHGKNLDKSERNIDRKESIHKTGNAHKRQETKNVEKQFGEHSVKTSNDIDLNQRKDNKSIDSSVKIYDNNREHSRKPKQYESKATHNSNQNYSKSLKQEKFEYNEEYDESLYNTDLKTRNTRSQRFNKNNPNLSSNAVNNHSSNSYNNLSRSNSNDISNDSNKNRTKHDNNAKQRNFSQNKSQNRYQYEQQIPPRFLKKQQQLLKQKMENENLAEEQGYLEPDVQDLKPTQSSNQSECMSHRGLIRLPTSNQINHEELHPNSFHKADHQKISSQIKFENKNISNKPCVAIRPTQHVSTDDYSRYSPSSSPEGSHIISNALPVDNFQHSSYMRSNFNEYSLTYENDMSRVQNISDISRKKLKPLIEKSFTEVIAAEKELHLCIKDQQKVDQIRYRIQLRYEHIILSDLRVCAEFNIEQKLWKSAFYQFIEHYRRLIEQNSEQSSEMKTAFHKIVDEASLFFENLLVKMQDSYNFAIETLLAHDYDRETENYDSLKLAAISAQKIYLYLGDLSRYKECEVRNSNFVKSKFYYTRAQQLAPKNGRSYNQLALLAMYQNRRLDAVYYYMRSLAASNPFSTARENLIAIFDEVRRKYETIDKKRKQDIVEQRNRNEEAERALKSDNERLEIWIRSDGTSAVCSNYKQFEEENQKGELESLSSVDLNKRFVLSFLHVHGKIFSRIGMETFVPVVNQMLSEFHCLLRRSPVPVSSLRLTQLLAINMFAVFNTSLKDTSYGQNCRSLLQEQAIQVTFAMILLILDCANTSLQQHIRADTHPNLISDDLSELLPTIKLWTDWMSCQKQLWCPPPPASDFKIDCKGDIWTIFAGFLTSLTTINVRSVKLLPSKLEGCEPVILPEDTALAGFLPLMGSPQCVQFTQPPYDKEKARTCLRITVIQFFGDYLCGIVEPYLKFDVEKKRFVSLIPTSSQSNSEDMIERIFSDDISETENEESIDMSSIETISNSLTDFNQKSPEQIEIEQLWSRQEALKKAKQRQELIRQRVDAVLSEENKNTPSRIIIQPRYIIADTNCFIDHLEKIKALIKAKYYDLIIPLVVINELKALKSRGIKTLKPLTFTEDHIGHVGEAAMKALDYLISTFNDKNSRLKAITTKGSLLDNINFISETFTDGEGNSNDDFILNACLHFTKDNKSSDKCPKDSVESNSIFREAILLTEDRNLRVKALGHNVPVKSLPIFIKWAKITVKSNRV